MHSDVHVVSYSVGLTNAQVDPEAQGTSMHFFKFTQELRTVIRGVFTGGADTPPLVTNAQVDPEAQGTLTHYFKLTQKLRTVIRGMFTRGAPMLALDASAQHSGARPLPLRTGLSEER